MCELQQFGKGGGGDRGLGGTVSLHDALILSMSGL